MGKNKKSIFLNNDSTEYFKNISHSVEIDAGGDQIISERGENCLAGVFNIPRNFHAVNELYLTIEMRVPEGNTVKNVHSLPEYFMAYFIQQVDVFIGTLPLTNLYPTDLIKCFFDAKTFSPHATSVLVDGSPHRQENFDVKHSIITRFRLPIFNILSRRLDYSYLMACVNDQGLSIKVYAQNLSIESLIESHYITPSNDVKKVDGSDAASSDKLDFSFRLFANKVIFEDDELAYIKDNRDQCNTKTTITESVSPQIGNQYLELFSVDTAVSGNSVWSIPFTPTSEDTLMFNADHVNIDCEYIDIVAAYPNYSPIANDTDVDINYPYFDVELQLGPLIINLPPERLKINTLENVFHMKILLGSGLEQDCFPLSGVDKIRLKLIPKARFRMNKGFMQSLRAIFGGKNNILYESGCAVLKHL